jgi:hypothetical protein
MKRLLVPLMAVLLIFSSVSCEDDDKSSSNDNYLQTEMVEVGTHDNLTQVRQAGDSTKIFYTVDSKFAIIPTSSTTIMTQRESCSGFSDGSIGDIQEYKYCEIKFTQYQIDWSEKPYEVRPTEIWVYRGECLYPVSTNSSDCIVCQ